MQQHISVVWRIGLHDAEIREAGPLTKHQETIDPALLLSAYAQGLFPMADGADDPSVHWVEPRQRAILPLDGFRLSRSLKKLLVSDRFRVTTATVFSDMVELSAEPAPDQIGSEHV